MTDILLIVITFLMVILTTLVLILVLAYETARKMLFELLSSVFFVALYLSLIPLIGLIVKLIELIG
jgi:predicted exporter